MVLERLRFPSFSSERRDVSLVATKCIPVFLFAVGLDTCTVAPFCHQNATCAMTNTSGESDFWKTCTCNDGYHGDGFVCEPVDPCQMDNGGCDVNTTNCVYQSPGKVNCLGS